jgi:hypothetical protein
MNIDNVTLVCIDTKNIYNAIHAIIQSKSKINFPFVKFFTNNLEDKLFIKLKNNNIEVIEIPIINNIIDYSRFCLTEINKHIDTKFCLIVQHDGYIINPECWTDKFLNFDYIGAPWPNKEFKNRVGNGGFSLRSKKFLEVCADLFKDYPNIPIKYNHPDYLHEDFLACNVYYNEMIERGIKFADVETASKFSIEHPILEMKNETFGFHGNFNTARKYNGSLL